jgi:membrane protease YdiL (CAAX protease family)
MKSRITLIIELVVFLVALLLLENILPFISWLFTREKEVIFLVARIVIIPVVSILFIIYLLKRWSLKLAFKFNDLLSSKLVEVILITALYFIIIFPFSYPVEFSKDFLSGVIQIPVFKQPDFTVGMSFWLFLNSIVIAPAIEEILFRGIIQTRITRNFSPKVSIVIASIIFAVSHFNLSRLVRTFLCGLLFGAIFNKNKSVVLSISAHSLINLMVYFTVRQKATDMNGLALYSMGYIACYFSLVLINRKFKMVR